MIFINSLLKIFIAGIALVAAVFFGAIVGIMFFLMIWFEKFFGWVVKNES